MGFDKIEGAVLEKLVEMRITYPFTFGDVVFGEDGLPYLQFPNQTLWMFSSYSVMLDCLRFYDFVKDQGG